jgi:hypothetical protein
MPEDVGRLRAEVEAECPARPEPTPREYTYDPDDPTPF